MSLSPIVQQSRDRYLALLSASYAQFPFWDHVVLTSSSAQQSESYRLEIRRRLDHGQLPPAARYHVLTDPGDRRAGSGAATLHALSVLPQLAGRILILHAGGDSRRLPQYSLIGKLFSALPVKSPWGEASTVFDEYLALSSLWAAGMPPGLLVGSGDVLLVFNAAEVHWPAPGVHGISLRQPHEVGSQHGVYILGGDRVYSFLQKPSFAEVCAAGGELPGSQVALDTGLLYFDPATTASLSAVANSTDWSRAPVIDLYTHFTLALTSQWTPAPTDAPVLHDLAGVLRPTPFTATLTDGEFTHIGLTSNFRSLMTEQTGVPSLYATHQRLGASTVPGVRSSGIIVDSVLVDAEIGPGAVVVECSLTHPLRAGRGSLLHGLDAIGLPLDVPDNTVLHQVEVQLPGASGTVLRVYGVEDDPKLPLNDHAVWLARPLLDTLDLLGISPHEVWPGTPTAERNLWNAVLFPVTTATEAWTCAQWLLGLPSGYDAKTWRSANRLSLEESARYADHVALLEARTRRARLQWQAAAVRLALDGADIRPMLAQSPGLAALSDVAGQLEKHAQDCAAQRPTDAASYTRQASLFHAQAGSTDKAQAADVLSFELVARAVRAGSRPSPRLEAATWALPFVTVSAPARIDLGGGWSDTPPFCLDWGGVVLNAGITLAGDYPIQTTLRVVNQPVIRCTGDSGDTIEYSRTEDLFAPPCPGDRFAIPRAVLQMSGLIPTSQPLHETLSHLGGGLELSAAAHLPMGSGLGTSSILAATVMQAFSALTGRALPPQELSDSVLALEQFMSTGGGWQDQAGGIFPGIKLLSSGPGLRQRIRAQQLVLTPQRQQELESQLVLVWTAITRVARGLLREVVGRYLARETRAVQVLHSIKTLALEMAHAIQDGDWDYLGDLLDRHWALNQVLDPNTTNAPTEALLAALRPHLRGAKLAGAGGGGFLILLARSPEDADHLRRIIANRFAEQGARPYACALAPEGLRVNSPL